VRCSSSPSQARCLTFADLDLNAEPHAILRVERSWDQQAGIIDPKSRAGTRTVPVLGHLRLILREHRLALGRADGLVFGAFGGAAVQPV